MYAVKADEKPEVKEDAKISSIYPMGNGTYRATVSLGFECSDW